MSHDSPSDLERIDERLAGIEAALERIATCLEDMRGPWSSAAVPTVAGFRQEPRVYLPERLTIAIETLAGLAKRVMGEPTHMPRRY